jgi:hypothetical protein
MYAVRVSCYLGVGCAGWWRGVCRCRPQHSPAPRPSRPPCPASPLPGAVCPRPGGCLCVERAHITSMCGLNSAVCVWIAPGCCVVCVGVSTRPTVCSHPALRPAAVSLDPGRLFVWSFGMYVVRVSCYLGVGCAGWRRGVCRCGPQHSPAPRPSRPLCPASPLPGAVCPRPGGCLCVELAHIASM